MFGKDIWCGESHARGEYSGYLGDLPCVKLAAMSDRFGREIRNKTI